MGERMVGEAREVNRRGRWLCGTADPRRVRERLPGGGCRAVAREGRKQQKTPCRCFSSSLAPPALSAVPATSKRGCRGNEVDIHGTPTRWYSYRAGSSTRPSQDETSSHGYMGPRNGVGSLGRG